MNDQDKTPAFRGKPNPKRGKTLNLILADEGFYFPSEDCFFPLEGGMEQTLTSLFDRYPGANGLKIHYQKTDILVLFLGAVSGSISQAVEARLSPGKSLVDYQLAFFNKIVALVPSAPLRKLFRFAESRQMTTCRVSAFPKLEKGSFLLQLRGQKWFIKANHEVPERILPLPRAGSLYVPDFDQTPPTLDLQNEPFDPCLFEWIDPREKKRRMVRKNRKTLILVSAICLGFLLLTGLFLWNWRRVSESRLQALSREHQIEKKQRQESQTIQAEIEKLVTEIQELNRKRGNPGSRSADLRRIMNLCPDTTLLQRLRFQRGLAGESRYLLDGYATESAGASVFLQVLESEFNNWRCVMNRLTEMPPKRSSVQGSLPKQIRYQFEISLEPQS